MNEMIQVSADLRFELDGVLADMDVGREFGAVCRATIVRVRDALTPGASNAEGQARRAEVETPASRERPAPSAPSKSNGGFLCVGECQHYINEHGLAERALRASAGERERADELGRDLSAAVEDTNVEARKLVRAFGELTAERERAERWKQEASIWRADLTRLQAEVERLREEADSWEAAAASHRERAEKAEAALNVAVALADQRYSLLKGFQAEIEGLREDTARLDWLDKAGWEEGHGFCCVHYGTYRHYVHAQSYDGRERSARAVIDTARKGKEERS